MQLPRTARRAVVPILLGVANARAQTSAAVGLGTLFQRSPGSPWQSATALSQSAQIDTRWTQLAGDGLFAGNGRGSMQLERLDVHGAFAPAPIGPLRWSTGFESIDGRAAPGDQQSEHRVESAVSIAGFGGGAWIGVGAEQGRDVDSRTTRPLMLFGLWRSFGRATFSLATSSRRAFVSMRRDSRMGVTTTLDSVFNDTTRAWNYFTHEVGASDSGRTNGSAMRWTEVEARLAWASSRVAIDATFGLRPHISGFSSATWGRVTTTYALAPRLALVAAAGSESALSSVSSSRAPFLSLGLRVAPAALVRPRPPVYVRPVASAFRVVAADSGHYRVSVHVAGARTLELSGDFDGWRPVSMLQTAPDDWETTLPLAPGTYRVNLRVNGDRWTAPPGLPTADDEFNGTVGLLVVP